MNGIPTVKRHTRYFIFTRLRPKSEDYIHIIEESKRINAHIIYITDTTDPECKVLKGLIILCGPTTHQNIICRNFPNFFLFPLPTNFELDFWNLPPDVFKVGQHPFDSVRKRLFKGLFDESSLSGFMRNERNQGDHQHIRTMVSSSTRTTSRT